MTPSGILDIIIIIYYFPALILAIYTGLKHGFSKSAGWFQLNLLSVFRLVGSSLGLAAIYQYNVGVIVASYVFSSMGTITLVGALLGLVGRVDRSLNDKAINPQFVKLINMITIAAIVISSVGGSYTSSNDAGTRDYGHYLAKVAVILVVVIYVLAVCICIHSVVLHRHVPESEKRLLYVSVISLPFVLVRLILAVCSTVLYSSSSFGMMSTSITAVVIKAIMGVLMEFIVVGLFLWAGCTVGRSAERDAQRAEGHGAKGVYQGRYGSVHDTELGRQQEGTVKA